MGQNPYPVEIAEAGGGPVKTAGDMTFTDPGNQPGGGSIAYVPPDGACSFESNNSVSIANNGLGLILWDEPLFAQTLLDTTDPEVPTVAEAGTYAVSVSVGAGSAMTADGLFEIELSLDYGADEGATIHGESRLATAAQAFPSAQASLTWHIAAGGAIRVACRNRDGSASVDFAFNEAIVQRIA